MLRARCNKICFPYRKLILYYRIPNFILEMSSDTKSSDDQNKVPSPVYMQQTKTKSSTEIVGGSFGSAMANAVRSGKEISQMKGSGEMLLSVGKTIGKGAVEVAKAAPSFAVGAVKGFKEENEKRLDTPVLQCFEVGSTVQLLNKASKSCLRCLNDGSVDGQGELNHDMACHWIVVKGWGNKLVLKSATHTSSHLSVAINQLVATGVGDEASEFKIHETSNHYVTIEHVITGYYVGINPDKKVLPANKVIANSQSSLFEVHLVHSSTGHTYVPKH